jgi:prevent-host-death family protein
MREFSFGQLSRKSSEVTAVADREPVALSRHRKPRYVLMSYDDFKAMTAQLADRRRAYAAENTPENVTEWLLPALDRFARGEDVGDD